MTPIESLHACYCQCSGLEVRLVIWQRSFHDFLANGFTEDDMRCVVQYLRRENKRMTGAAYSLRLDKLLDFEYRHFDSLLSEARARERNRVSRTPAERILATRTGGVMATKTGDSARPASEVTKSALMELARGL